jgi:hypothetical protein
MLQQTVGTDREKEERRESGERGKTEENYAEGH